ncbi:MAG: hypothetical protein ACJ70X_08260 [Nitrososphaera sp.]
MFPLDEAREALDYPRDIHLRGKIILAIQQANWDKPYDGRIIIDRICYPWIMML